MPQHHGQSPTRYIFVAIFPIKWIISRINRNLKSSSIIHRKELRDGILPVQISNFLAFLFKEFNKEYKIKEKCFK